MRCAELRELLTRRTGEAPAPGADREIAAHLASCRACARYVARLAQARAVLAREGEVLPDLGFARRVIARLPTSAQVLGWAALRALPAAIVLALAISAFGLLQTPSVESSLLGGEASNEVLFTYAALPPDTGAPASAPAPAPQERR